MKIWKIISSRQILDPNLDQSFSILTSRSIEAVAGALGIQNGQAAASLAIAEKWDFNLAQLIIFNIFTATTLITIILIIIISILILIREDQTRWWCIECCEWRMFAVLCFPTAAPLPSPSLNPFYLESKYFTWGQNIWYMNRCTNIYTIQVHKNAYNIFKYLQQCTKYRTNIHLANLWPFI